jgi:hypothetical protein
MKTLVLRLRQMNEVMGQMDPQRRRMRDMFKDWQKSNETAEVAESERWAQMSQEESEIELNFLGAFRYGIF